MENQFDKLKKALEDCTVIYKGQVISDYSLLGESIEFFVELINQGCKDSGRGIILHPGTSIHLLFMTVTAALSCILFEERSQEDIIDKLNPGDLVIYEKKRGVFIEKDGKGRAVIQQANSITCYVPRDRFYRIKPYKGTGTALDGRGIRENPEEHQVFLSKILKMKPGDIPSVVNRSVVIVCNRQEADLIMNNIELCIKGEEKTALRNLFPAAYYTHNDRYNYAGNFAKIEPVLKFTGRVSVARKLIIDDREKNIIGLLVNGNSIIETGISELSGLLSRRSLRNVLLLSRIDDNDYRGLLNEFENLKLFAWTKEAILSSRLDLKTVPPDEKKLLIQHVDNILDKEINIIMQKLDLDLDVNELKKILLRIARTELAGSEREEFAINGFGLLNLLTYSVFPLKDLEIKISDGTIEAVSPKRQLNNLISIADEFKGSLREDMEMVIKILSRFYETIYSNNPKHNALLQILYDNYIKRRKTAIIVPNQYYKTAFEATVENKQILKYCEFITKSRFRNEKLYDQIIISGAFKGKRFNLFGTNASANINVLVYHFEESKVRALKQEFAEISGFYDSRNYISVSSYAETNEHLPDNYLRLDDNLERYFEELIINSATAVIKQSSVEGQPTVEVAKVVTFETGERAFFTKNYCPYVFNPETGAVTEETDISKLAPGDILIFTKHTDKTRDIVDKVLDNLVGRKECEDRFKESYRKALYWKDVLRIHMKKFELSFRDLSDEMFKMGYGKHEATIRSWLDEDSHIVGPREPETFYAIASITKDESLLKDPEGFCEACNEVRSMRIRILKYIGLSIIKSVGGTITTDEYLEKLIGDASEFVITLQIENIVQAKELFVPSYMANRPHEF